MRPAAAAIAICLILASCGEPLGSFTTSIAPGLHPRLAPADAVGISRAYLDAQTPELAAPELHRPPEISDVWAVLARDAKELDGCIPSQLDDRIVWVTKGRGDYLNLHDHPWSHAFTAADQADPALENCRGSAPGGTIAIDDATGEILGVYPFAAGYPHPTIETTSSASSAPPSPTPSQAPASSASQASPAPAFDAIAFFDRNRGLLGGSIPNGTDSGANPPRGALQRTDDGGRTWSDARFAHGPITALATLPDGHAWAATGCEDRTCPSQLLESADSGRTWTARPNRLFADLSFVDDSHGWAVGPGGPPDLSPVFRTRDGGHTWSSLGNPCPFGWAAAVSFASPNRGWVACASEPGAGQQRKAIVETDDAGRSWSVRSEAGIDHSVGHLFISDYVTGISMRPSEVGLMWMGRGTTAATSDSGRTWRAIPPGDFDVIIPAAGTTVDDRTWFLVAWDGNVGREVVEVSHDAGSTWSELALGAG
jgi:photosystem II stability/assembly factor-like uncharacterized protein